jgi:hypothetical protein
MAKEQRNQDRISQGYLQLVTFLQRYRERAAQLASLTGAPADQEGPTLADRRNIKALVDIYGSPGVRSLLAEWTERVTRLEVANATIQTARASRDTASTIHQDADRELKALPGYEAANREADEAIRAQVRSELGD